MWEETLILLPKHINLILLSATINKPEKFWRMVINLKIKKIFNTKKRQSSSINLLLLFK